jgi:hypothetical protein
MAYCVTGRRGRGLSLDGRRHEEEQHCQGENHYTHEYLPLNLAMRRNVRPLPLVHPPIFRASAKNEALQGHQMNRIGRRTMFVLLITVAVLAI